MVCAEFKISKNKLRYTCGGEKAHGFNYIICFKFFRETENKVPKMSAPHRNLLSDFIYTGYDISVKCTAFQRLKQKRKKKHLSSRTEQGSNGPGAYKQRKLLALHPFSQHLVSAHSVLEIVLVLTHKRKNQESKDLQSI